MTATSSRDKHEAPALVDAAAGQLRERPHAPARLPTAAARRASRGSSRSARARSSGAPPRHGPALVRGLSVGDRLIVATELALARKKLRSWTKPERVPTSLVGQPGRSRIYREPLGVVLIIGPWNYPLQLVLVPWSARSRPATVAVVKPSELAPATSALDRRRGCREYLDAECVRIVEGGVPETTALLGGAIRSHLLHRQRHGRPHRHGGGGQAPDAGHARARRQEPVHRRPAHRSRRRRPAHRLGEVLQRRPDLRRPRLRARPQGDRGARCRRA